MKKTTNMPDIIITAVLVVLFLITVLPLVIMVFTSLKDETQILQNFWGLSWPLRLENYVAAFNEIYRYFFNSIFVTVTTVIGLLVVSIFAGYAFGKLVFPGRDGLFLAIMAFRMVPTGLLIIPMFLNILTLGLDNNYFGVILPNIATGSVVATMLARSFFMQIPDDIFEAARIDGAGELKLLSQILVPLSKPIIGTIAVMNFFTYFNQYRWPYIVLSDDSLKTIPIGLAKLAGEHGVNFGLQMAGYTLVAIPLIILFMCTSKIYVGGVTSGAVKG